MSPAARGAGLVGLWLALGRAELPSFPHTYDMQQSSLIMACNDSGYLDMSNPVGKYGVVDFDWSNANPLWENARPMDTEESMVRQAKMRKAAICPEKCPYPKGCSSHGDCPEGKVWVYRNLLKALPWFSSVREKIVDPAYSGFFLHFNRNNVTPYTLPVCDNNWKPPRCSWYWHDQWGTPKHPGGCKDACDCGEVPCGEYLFDHRNGTMLREWLVNEYISGPNGLSNPNIDGFFIDDAWLATRPSETVWHPSDAGFTQDDVDNIRRGWQANMLAVKSEILRRGGFNWQMFDVGEQTNAGPPFQPKDCTNYMRNVACRPDSPLQNQSLFYGFTRPKNSQRLLSFAQDLASFLLIRGPYAWLGYSWLGCSDSDPNFWPFPRELAEDYGEPVGVCTETGEDTEIFTRTWSKVTVRLDCAKWEAHIEPRTDSMYM